MANNSNSALRPVGSALFSGSESFMRDLSAADESTITGGGGYYGGKSGSKSGSKSRSKSRSKSGGYGYYR